MTKTRKVIISAVIVVLLLAVYIAFDRRSRKANENLPADNTQTATSTNIVIDGNGKVVSQNTGGYKIEQVPIESGSNIPIPDLDRQSVAQTGAIVSPEAKTLAASKIKQFQMALKSNPADLESWIYLGSYQKMAGDYAGAEITWKYATKIAPTDFVSRANLGNLYAYFLKDNGQAEVYYKDAIAKGPMQVYLYMQLAEVYRDVFKDNDKARAIVAEGLKKIPNDPNLVQLRDLLK